MMKEVKMTQTVFDLKFIDFFMTRKLLYFLNKAKKQTDVRVCNDTSQTGEVKCKNSEIILILVRK